MLTPRLIKPPSVDRRGDGIIWPTDTLWGFRDLGYGWFVSIASMCIVHIVFACVPSSPQLPPSFYKSYH